MKKVLLNLVFLFALVCFAGAQEFKVADIFSDNMVLQQKINNPFWGWGKPGTKVTISTSWNPQKNRQKRVDRVYCRGSYHCDYHGTDGLLQ